MSTVTRQQRGNSSGSAGTGGGDLGAIGKRTLVEACGGAQLRLKASGPGQVTGEAARSVASAAMAGPPQPLPYRRDMEQQFGVPLDHIGAHTGSTVEEAGRSLGASAFALGDQVAFAESSPSRSTVAHEVTHVLQQTRGGGAGSEAHDEAEAVAAEGGAAPAIAPGGGAGATAVRRQAAPQPTQEAPLLDTAASRDAIKFSEDLALPAEAWTKIAAVVGLGTTTIDDAMVQAIARWQQGQKLTGDGKAGDITLQWMSSSPGGGGLDAYLKSEPIAYLGLNTPARTNELSALRGTGAKVSGATGRRQQDTAVVGGQSVNLTTEEGREAYVAQFDRFDETARGTIKTFLAQSLTASRDELAQFVLTFYEAEIGQRIIKRVVLSGHSGGYSIFGEGVNATTIDFYDLKALGTMFPRAVGQVEDLMLSACNTGQTGKLKQFRAIFPNLRSIWAYVGYSPAGKEAGAGSNRHIEKWEGASRGRMDHGKLDAAREDLATGSGTDQNVALWTRDSATATEQYETASPEAGQDFATLRASVDSGLSVYEDAYKNGNINLTELSALYTRLQNLTGSHQSALGSHYDRYLLITKHVLYLRHWSNIRNNFWAAYGPTVTKAYEGHGTVPSYRTGSRSDVLRAIDGFPGDKGSEGYRLLTEILRDLDPAQIPDHWV